LQPAPLQLLAQAIARCVAEVHSLGTASRLTTRDPQAISSTFDEITGTAQVKILKSLIRTPAATAFVE
jgi:hypothetical protein